MIRIISDDVGVTIVTEGSTYEIMYDEVESFEVLVTLLNDLGFDAEFEAN